MSLYQAVDLFAGPGGWDVAYRKLSRGAEVIGIEVDEAACETRRAAGLLTMQADVRLEDPCDRIWRTYTATEGLIASPPCQTFSVAGKQSGLSALDVVFKAAKEVWDGLPIPYDSFEDERTGLVLEPLRWIMDRFHETTYPFRWIALEQVPGVQPVWDMYRDYLQSLGYSVATGIVHAEQYGVPQTRKRAVLLAHLTREVKLPAPTHRKYRKGVAQHEGDPNLLPWVSMRDALTWEGLIGWPRRDDGRGADHAVEINGQMWRARDLRSADNPSATVTEKARAWVRFCPTNVRPKATLRDLDEPASTLAFGHETPRWLVAAGRTGEGRPRPDSAPAPTVTGKGTAYWLDDTTEYVGGTGKHATKRSLAEPAPTVHFGERLNKVEWQRRNSGPGAARDPRSLDDPSYTIRANGSGSHPSGVEWGREATAVRVSTEEAGVLQSFPADYPWRGSRTKQYQQIGNAIPPVLAEALLREVMT